MAAAMVMVVMVVVVVVVVMVGRVNSDSHSSSFDGNAGAAPGGTAVRHGADFDEDTF